MAVTSLWPIKYRLDKVINYVRNPEKITEEYYSENAAMHVIDGVLEYAADDTKTERREYVSPCEWRGGARHCSRAMVGESGLETC